MLKDQIKVKLSNDSIVRVIKNSYDRIGQIIDDPCLLKIDDSIDRLIFKGLGGLSVKILNELVDGSIIFRVYEDNGDIWLLPTSKYFVKIDDKYSFY